jgi:hypothetical protein
LDTRQNPAQPVWIYPTHRTGCSGKSIFFIDSASFTGIIVKAVSISSLSGITQEFMIGSKRFSTVLISILIMILPGWAHGEMNICAGEGTIVTFWPLADYRESPQEKYGNLSLLGPLFKLQWQKDDRDIAVRPLFYTTSNKKDKATVTEYLYPLASSETSPEVSTFQVIQLYQNNIYRKDEEGKQEKGTMIFPFYISGTSKKYGPYTSVFPFYGDIYERFWRDEYHYVLFPIYGRTVKKGTTTSNYLYPFFSTTEGDRESGFQFWPLYGQSAKEGVYSKRFVAWPLYLREKSGLDTDNPASKLYLLPLYAATDSPVSTSRYYFWPFFGYKSDREGMQEERDIFWPFIRTIRGENRTLDSYLPFYSRDVSKETRKRWVFWPAYMNEEIDSAIFRQHRERVFYFLYSDNRESWPKDGAERRRTAFWPFFVYNLDTRGVKSLALPAPVESFLDREGIEKSWAPFWRLYQQKWNDKGDSAVSFLWNLYWHEQRDHDLAVEFYPVLEYLSAKETTDVKLLKGLFHYRHDAGVTSVTFFWLPFGAHWGKPEQRQS